VCERASKETASLGVGAFLLLLLEVIYRCLDSVLGQHAAVQLHRWKTQVLGNIVVGDLQALVDRLSFHPLRVQ
jgi:hypothetical protein